MDWLDDLMVNHDAEQIAALLQTPHKKKLLPTPLELMWSRSSTPPRPLRRRCTSLYAMPSRPDTPKSSNRKKSLKSRFGSSTSSPHLSLDMYYHHGGQDQDLPAPPPPPLPSNHQRSYSSLGLTYSSSGELSSCCSNVSPPELLEKKQLFPSPPTPPPPPAIPAVVGTSASTTSPSTPPPSPRLSSTTRNNSSSTSDNADPSTISPAAAAPTASHTANVNTTVTTTTTTSTTSSPFYKKSISIGNGWNAKGLRKARRGLWQDAVSCWDNALDIRCQLLGPCHLDVAQTYNNRGIALGKVGEWQLAISSLGHALDIQRQVLGDTHAQVASTVHNLANVHLQAGDLQGAIRLFGQSKQLQLVICEQAKRRNELNIKKKAQKKKKTQKKTHKDRHEEGDSDHEDTKVDQDDVPSAASAASHIASYPPSEVPVARACVAMGHVYYEARQYQDAREAYLDALGIYISSGVSPTDPEVSQVTRDVEEIDLYFAKLQQEQHRQQQQHHQQQQGVPQAPIHLVPTAPYLPTNVTYGYGLPLASSSSLPPATPHPCYYGVTAVAGVTASTVPQQQQQQQQSHYYSSNNNNNTHYHTVLPAGDQQQYHHSHGSYGSHKKVLQF